LEESDEALVLRVAAGDREACRVLVERHLARIVAFARRVLGDPAAAEDVAQETFLRLWARADLWRPGRARFTTWLHRVALNLCLDRMARRREAPLDPAVEPRDDSPSVAALVHGREIARRVDAAIAGLPESQRIAIALCHHQGLRNIEAAEAMGISVEALESLLARGRRTLREQLRDLLAEMKDPA
jgi:RNA polymerase sigma-70 factor (ECF subfamily)